MADLQSMKLVMTYIKKTQKKTGRRADMGDPGVRGTRRDGGGGDGPRGLGRLDCVGWVPGGFWPG